LFNTQFMFLEVTPYSLPSSTKNAVVDNRLVSTMLPMMLLTPRLLVTAAVLLTDTDGAKARRDTGRQAKKYCILQHF